MWAYFNKEYGVTASWIEDLHGFQSSKASMNDTAKFEELYQIWREVADDLRKIKLEESLNNPHALNMFQLNLLSSPKEKYVDLKHSPAIKGEEAA